MLPSVRLVLALLLASLLASGCVTTRAWQREDLARPEMAVDGDDADGLRAHVLSTREGAVGGGGGGGGGCGCN
jgi:hypothetical protein